MAKYTTEIRTICEALVSDEIDTSTSTVTEIIRKARPHIFDFDYPLFDEDYRTILEEKIIRHYYTREIGLETYGLWKLKLETVLNEIMPYYNKLYTSETILINPLYTFNYVKKHEDGGGDTRTVEETNNVTNDGTVKNKTDINEHTDRNGNTTEHQTTKDTSDVSTAENGVNSITFNEFLSGTNRIVDGYNTQEHNQGSNNTTSENYGGETSQNINKGSTTNDTLTNDTNDSTIYSNKIEALKDLYSDTPQGEITGLEDNKYLTNARLNNNNIITNGTNNITNTGTSKINESTEQENKNITTNANTGSTINTTSNDGSVTYSRTADGTDSNQKTGNDTTRTENNSTTEKENNGETNTTNTTSDVTDGNKTSNTETTTNNVENGVKQVSDIITTNREYIEHVSGSNGVSESKLLIEYRNTFLNIDVLIIDELEKLFMQIW